MSDKKLSPKQHLKEVSAEVRSWPVYMRVRTSAYAKWLARQK